MRRPRARRIKGDAQLSTHARLAPASLAAMRLRRHALPLRLGRPVAPSAGRRPDPGGGGRGERDRQQRPDAPPPRRRPDRLGRAGVRTGRAAFVARRSRRRRRHRWRAGRGHLQPARSAGRHPLRRPGPAGQPGRTARPPGRSPAHGGPDALRPAAAGHALRHRRALPPARGAVRRGRGGGGAGGGGSAAAPAPKAPTPTASGPTRRPAPCSAPSSGSAPACRR